MFYIFLKAHVILFHFLCGFPAHIPVMPRLISDFCNICFILWIPENKTVFPAVFHKPLLFFPLFLCLIKHWIINCNDIHCQPRLMFTPARKRNPSGCLLPGLSLRTSLIQILIDIALQKICLALFCPVCRTDGGIKPSLSGRIHHFLQIRQYPPVYLAPII